MCRRLIAAAFVVASSSAFALQLVEPVEGVNSFVKISAKEQTRIAVENGKIQTLIANDGEIVAEKDLDRGQIFIRPTRADKPINVRVIPTSGKTYSLVLQPVDIPQEDVIIRDPASTKEKVRAAAVASRTTDYATAIKEVIAAMTAPAGEDASLEHREVNQELALWEGTRFVKRATYESNLLIGDKYELFNTGKEPIRMVEQEFFLQGVVAVAITSLVLAPGASTEVFIVREGAR